MNHIKDYWEIDPKLSEITIQYASNYSSADSPRITTPEAAFSYLMRIWNRDTLDLREEFIVVPLSVSKASLGWCKIGIGNKKSTIVDITQLVALAILSNADSLLIAHNHPSGNLIPSRADIRLTRQVQEALRLHSITLVEHMIITRNGWYSIMTESKSVEGFTYG